MCHAMMDVSQSVNAKSEDMPCACRFASGLPAELASLEQVVAPQESAIDDAVACQAAWLSLCAIVQQKCMQAHIAARLEAVKSVETRWRLMIIHLQVQCLAR